MERLTLTGAELSYLISLSDDLHQRTAARRLRMPSEERTAAMVRAGLSSFSVRGLAAPDGQQIRLAPAVTAVLRGITEPTLWVEIAALYPGGGDAGQFYVHPDGRLMLSPRALGCFEASGVRRDLPPVEPLLGMARSLLSRPAPATVTFRAESVDAGGSVAIASSVAGSYTVSVGPPGQVLPTIEEALTLTGAYLAEFI